MKIINLGILAHVDAGKTTLTESLLYTSGAIAEPGSVDKGTTSTDTMNLERQRGITIQTAVTSFQWEDVKVNIIDTPGHMDFLAEVYRSLSVLDGAVLLVSAKDGIQAQTRILFHALQIMKIPTIFFINKIDQEGIDLPMVYREMKAKLSSEIIVKQKVGQHPHINVTDNDDMEQWDAVIMGNDELLEKYMSGKPFKMSELEQEENRRFQNGTLFPVYHGSAKNNLGIRQLIEVIASKFYSSTPEGQSELCGQVFKIEYSEKRRRFVYVRIYSGTLHLRDVIKISEKEKIKITEMYVPTNGELYSSDTACSGDIVILPNDVLQLNSILGNEILLPQRKFIENPLPMLQTTIAVKKSEQREILLGALTEISDGDPLLKYYVSFGEDSASSGVSGYTFNFKRVFEGRVVRNNANYLSIDTDAKGNVKSLGVALQHFKPTTESVVTDANAEENIATLDSAIRADFDSINVVTECCSVKKEKVTGVKVTSVAEAYCVLEHEHEQKLLPCVSYVADISVDEGQSNTVAVVDVPHSRTSWNGYEKGDKPFVF